MASPTPSHRSPVMSNPPEENQTMSALPPLEELDRDGAIRETAEAAAGDSRAGFLRRALVAGGGLAGAGALLAAVPSVASALTNRDVDILNFALTLQFARVVAAHEADHVKALKKVLGSRAIAKPRFNFHGTTANQGKFQQTAIALEDTGVCAYKGQAPRIQERAILNAALSIHTVEAHHAAWIRHIAGVSPAPHAFDQPCTMQQVLAAVDATHFIVSSGRPSSPRPRTTPAFTG